MIDERERAVRRRLMTDFPYYARTCLRIRPKDGGLIPFALNRVQRRIHEALEAQFAETGWVRAVILKARQPGCSTYVEGGFEGPLDENNHRGRVEGWKARGLPWVQD